MKIIWFLFTSTPTTTMILILTWPRLSWTICLVSGRETLRKKKNETPIWKINHQWRRMRWKMKLEYLQIEADRGRLAGEQGGGSWSSILPSPHCTWNIFCWSFLDCAIAHALPVCPGFSQGQLPGALLVDLALLVGNQLPFLLWNFLYFLNISLVGLCSGSDSIQLGSLPC